MILQYWNWLIVSVVDYVDSDCSDCDCDDDCCDDDDDSDNDDNGDDVREIIWLYYISFRIRESDSWEARKTR